MKTAAEYRKQNARLMEEYEQKVRRWLRKDDKYNIADKIPFFRDGVTNPEVWFTEGNNFRPLFILKEVSIGKESAEELTCYLEEWGNPKYFEFAENPFDDIKNGQFSQWRRIARLAKGLEKVYHESVIPEYYCFDLDYKKGNIKYDGDIEGYKKYKPLTANKEYIDIINKIAILEIKKVGGGKTVGLEISKATKYYSEHIEPFADLLAKQIELIDPTVIICLGRENEACISKLFNNIKPSIKERIWLDGYHHVLSSNDNFYYAPLKKYMEALQK